MPDLTGIVQGSLKLGLFSAAAFVLNNVTVLKFKHTSNIALEIDYPWQGCMIQVSSCLEHVSIFIKQPSHHCSFKFPTSVETET